MLSPISIVCQTSNITVSRQTIAVHRKSEIIPKFLSRRNASVVMEISGKRTTKEKFHPSKQQTSYFETIIASVIYRFTDTDITARPLYFGPI